MNGQSEAMGGVGERDALVDAPLYNIGVVARMTGIPVATLRVWERRYGFPAAARTEGGQRIYSQHEVQRLRWVKARVDDGMQVGKAVHALQMTETAGGAIERGATGVGTGGATGTTAPSVPVTIPLRPTPGHPNSAPGAPASSLAAFQGRLVEALLAHDLDDANAVVGDALAVFPVETLVLGVLRPALVEIGDGWAAGRVSVATEHLASHFVRQRLMLWLATAPAPRPVPPVVLACAPGEWHDIGLLMLGLMLSRRRWPIAYLGQAVPLADLADFVATVQPSAVVLVAMHADTAAGLVDWPAAMPQVAAAGRPVVCFGGRVFTLDAAWRARVPGAYLGDGLEDGVAEVERLMGGEGA